ncbi:hypothetical protein BDZ97DRAFT_1856410 [Flammula alnicola]|nr:hypothetical protein BDZ97DRAFT_1856410 [Flammula alnicola]
MNSPWEKPAVEIEIVGKHLILILCHNNANRPDDCVFIYELTDEYSQNHLSSPTSKLLRSHIPQRRAHLSTEHGHKFSRYFPHHRKTHSRLS